MSYRVNHLSPMIPSFNIPETVRFFKEVLEFETVRDDTTYVILGKNNFLVHILRAGTDIGEMEFYMEVDDVDALWNAAKEKLHGLKVKPPFDQPYGMREMHVIVPETKTLMFVGQFIGSR